MFGYVKVYKPELKVREYDFYRGVYCGLCRSMGRCTGCVSRVALSYDFAFLALVRMALTGEEYRVERRRCSFKCGARRATVVGSEACDFAARAAASVTYAKLLDDRRDERGAKKLRASLLLPFWKHARKKAGLPELDKVIETHIRELTECEARREPSFDAPAEINGRMLGEIFAYRLEKNSPASRIAYEIGFHAGKFVYAADAADDFADDAKEGRYNPFIALYGRDELTAEEREDIKTAVIGELSALERAVNLIDFSDCRGIEGIIKNIIYLGMPEATDRALSEDKKRKEERLPDE